jgi:REP element-mobilizing transposase RayT
MPNHFHFLIQADESTVARKINLNLTHNALSEGIRLLLSSYTKGINKQEGRTGNLIQQNTKSKCLYAADGSNDYLKSCFDYIHFNPVSSGMVDKPEDWDFSSYIDYLGLRTGTLCNQALTKVLIGAQFEKFKRGPLFTEEMIDRIF